MKVFVYGILKEGRRGSHYLSKATKLGSTTTLPEYTMISLGGFPGVIEGGTTSIIGEVYEIDQRELDNLDRLEGYPSFYDRKQIVTEYGKAWMYYLDKKEYGKYTVIETGEW